MRWTVAAVFGIGALCAGVPAAGANGVSNLLDCAFGAGQVFDVSYSYSGTLGVDRMLNVSNAKYPYQSANPPAGALTDDEVADGDYFAFVESSTDPDTYALQQFDSSDALVRTLHETGSFRATGPGVIHYLGNGIYGTVFTTQTTLQHGGSASFDVTDENPTDVEVLSFTDCSDAPLSTDAVPDTWSDETLGAMEVGVAFSDGVEANGSPAPTYAVTAGALPAGLSLDPSTGAITGTPTDGGAYAFTITATNSSGSIDAVFTGTVTGGTAGVAPAAWSDESLGAMMVGTAFSDAVEADGTPPPTYAVTGGALPAGLSLVTATGAISGTPTTAGAYSVTVTATNDEGSISTTITGTVSARPPAAVELELGFGTGDDLSSGGVTTTVRGANLKPGSAYTLTLFSVPRVLATGVADASGSFSQQIAIPGDVEAGSHRLVISGIDVDGNAIDRAGWFWVDEFGVVGNVSTTGPVSAPPMLARSGAEVDGLVLVGGVLTALGCGAILARRRLLAGRAPLDLG